MFRPINLSCRLLTPYYFPLRLFFDIRDINDPIFVDITRDSISLYDYMLCRVEVR